MIKSKIKVFSGLLLLFFGLAVVFTSLAGMTGFAVSGNLSSGVSAAIGIIPIVAGLIIIFSERGGDSDDDRYTPDRMRGTDSLRSHNNEAHYAMTQRYIQEHGQKPSAQQLREYIRKYHETGELDAMMNDDE